MSDQVIIKQVNASYLKIDCPLSVAYELNQYFSFKVPNAQFNPKVRNKLWDGIIRLFHVGNKQIYAGLKEEIIQFCKDRDYEVIDQTPATEEKVTFEDIEQFIEQIDVQLPDNGSAYEYQIQAIVNAINEKRTLTLSPTSSGKSFIIYVLARYLNMKTIVVVDRKAYVEQIYDDFARYGFDVENNAVKIYGGREKTADKQIVITTWQSIIKLDDEWFEQFDAMIGDEIHKFKAMSLKNIMERLTNCHYRNGFTGTIDDKQLNTLTLMGLFGAIHRTTTTKELIESGRVARPIIKFVKLKYELQDCIDLFSKIAKRKKTDNAVDVEIDYLIPLEKRNKYIINLALSLKGNTIVLFQYKEHGKILFEELQKRENRPENIYYVDGDVDVKIRKKIQHAIDSHENSITIASIGTFAENINIRHLNNAILAMPIKDKIRLLQALGRILRKTKTKDSAMFFDIIDMFIIKNKSNPTSKYGVERMKIFSKEQLDYKTYTIEV